MLAAAFGDRLEQLAQPLPEARVRLRVVFLQLVVYGVRVLAGGVRHLLLEPRQADRRVGRFVDGQQVERFGVQQEQQAVQQRQRGIVGLAEELVAGLGFLVKMAAAVCTKPSAR